MGLFDRIKHWVDQWAPPPMPPKPPSEIDRVIASALRWHARIERMQDEWAAAGGVCCPGCMFGHDFTYADEKLKRVTKWLTVLLRRRGRPEDLALADAIDKDAWP